MRTSFVLRPHVNKDGTQTIALRVFNGKYKHFSVNLSVPEKYWDADFQRVKKSYKSSARINDMLSFLETRINEAQREFVTTGKQFSFSAFEEMVFGQSRQSAGTILLSEYFQSVISEMESAGRHGNARVYEIEGGLCALFNSGAALSEINLKWLLRFEQWQRDRGKKNGGIAVTMRTLRAVCNRAIKDGTMPRDWYPFHDYSIGARLKQARDSRAISLEKMKLIEKVDLSGALDFARDLFLFSFYTRGMNLRDIARLTTDNLKDGRIVYMRHKTRRAATKKLSVKIKPQAQALIEKYAGRMEGKLFPIVGVGVAEDEEMKTVNNLTGRVNKNIRKVGGLVGIDEHLTFYTARHSYANALKQRGASYDLIGDAFGHVDRRSTASYLDSFPDSAIDEADGLLD